MSYPAQPAGHPLSAASPERGRAGAILREWADTAIVALVLAMFVRAFILELFEIPTGSMAPTLVGGYVANVDYNEDGREDLVLFQGGAGSHQVFIRESEWWRELAPQYIPRTRIADWEDQGLTEARHDKILVNKMSYYFHPPRRGDIVVFKAPAAIWEADKPIYIKRCAGEPGDRLGFGDEGRLIANGHLVEKPGFFESQLYEAVMAAGLEPPPGVEKRELAPGFECIESVETAPGEIFVLGDNAHNSLDSRYWGGAPVRNVRGRAFFRFMPFRRMKFLK